MHHTWHLPHTILKAVLLLAVSLMFSRFSTAQTYDLQIMVNGSWDYVVDPHPEKDPNPNAQKQKRIALVVPITPSHAVHIFGGAEASKYKGQTELGKGLYFLDIEPSLRTGNGKRSAADHSAATYSVPNISQARIAQIFSASPPLPRIIISLPAPDYYTTYAGPSGAGPNGEGTNESKIGKVLTGPWTKPTEYTTWMVLHYQVTGSSTATLSNSIDDGTPPPIKAIPFDQNNPSFNIVAGATMDGDVLCDLMSLESFKQSKKLWGNPKIYARFPEPSDQLGHQNRGRYHYWCFDPSSIGFSRTQSSFRVAQDNYKTAIAAAERLNAELEPKEGGGSANAAPVAPASKKDLAIVGKSLDGLALGHVPPKVADELTCLRAVINGKPPSTCQGRSAPSRQTIERYLADIKLQLGLMAVGGADCHKAQLNINGAIQ